MPQWFATSRRLIFASVVPVKFGTTHSTGRVTV